MTVEVWPRVENEPRPGLSMSQPEAAEGSECMIRGAKPLRFAPFARFREPKPRVYLRFSSVYQQLDG
eukprot:1344719-Rhodomonas_salina.1